MSGKTKTWTERLHDGKAHTVKPAPIDIAGMKAGQIMLVPTALMVDAFIRTLPKGRSLNARQLREAMAAAQGAEVTCPITTGFHLRTVAEAAWEALADGTPIRSLTPVWRVLPPDSLTLKKLSFDSAFIQRQRDAEGLDAEPATARTRRVSRRS
jgi:hypothetical protein